MYMFPYSTSSGAPLPLGSTVTATGVNFSIFSQHATSIELLLFDSAIATVPAQIVPLQSRTLFYWHVHVDGLQAPAFYAYRVDGPSTGGNKFNQSKVLIDPYAHGSTNNLWIESDALDQSDNSATSLRSVAIDIDRYDWSGDMRPNTPIEDTIIYELHTRGFTNSATSNVANRGTFSGLIEKLPYLKALGVPQLSSCRFSTLMKERFGEQIRLRSSRLRTTGAIIRIASSHRKIPIAFPLTPAATFPNFEISSRLPCEQSRGDTGCGVQPLGRRKREWSVD